MNVGQRLTLAAVALGLAAMAMPAMAQDAPEKRPPAERRERPRQGGPERPQPGMMVERLREAVMKLDLSADQKTQIEKILADAKAQVEALRDQKDLKPAEHREKMQAIVKETREKVGAVLTPEQKEKLQASMAREGGPLERLQQVAKELKLTDEQKGKIETILADARKEFQALREKGDPQANREAMGKLLRSTREKVSQVLTPEQSQKLNELLDRRDGQGPGGPRDGAKREEGSRDGARRGGNRERGDR